jgi:hypothetical protein
MKRCIALASFLALIGCAHVTPEEAKAERDRAMRCARVEVYPMGITPPRPYRVLGLVSSTRESSTSRTHDLQEKACAIGADAVVDMTEQQVVQDPTAAGTTGSTTGSGATAGGTAVAFTDSPTATPQAATP